MRTTMTCGILVLACCVWAAIAPTGDARQFKQLALAIHNYESSGVWPDDKDLVAMYKTDEDSRTGVLGDLNSYRDYTDAIGAESEDQLVEALRTADELGLEGDSLLMYLQLVLLCDIDPLR